MTNVSTIDFNAKKGFICDMDGVIYHGNQVLPGVAEFLDWLHEEKKEYLFLTNNSGYTPRELNQKLARMGLSCAIRHPAALRSLSVRRGCSTRSTMRASL